MRRGRGVQLSDGAVHPVTDDRARFEAMLRPDPADRLPDMRTVAERFGPALDDKDADDEDALPARPHLALVTTSNAASVDVGAEIETGALFCPHPDRSGAPPSKQC